MYNEINIMQNQFYYIPLWNACINVKSKWQRCSKFIHRIRTKKSHCHSCLNANHYRYCWFSFKEADTFDPMKYISAFCLCFGNGNKIEFDTCFFWLFKERIRKNTHSTQNGNWWREHCRHSQVWEERKTCDTFYIWMCFFMTT